VSHFGKPYLGFEKIQKDASGLKQDAHEAIRPTSLERTPEAVSKYLTKDQLNVYTLIYQRALASLMSAKMEDVTTVVLKSGTSHFKVEGVVTTFDGFTKVYPEGSHKDTPLEKMEVGQKFAINKVTSEQKFTSPPSHLSEAKLVKKMEELGIGRPSTYASTIDTIVKRRYVTSEKGILTITDQGKLTTETLEKYFPKFVDAKYTASMETVLDGIIGGKDSRVTVLSEFYFPFVEEIKQAGDTMEVSPYKRTGELCPDCGGELVIKTSHKGVDFISCANYPTCKYSKSLVEKQSRILAETCPECGKPLVERMNKRNQPFVGCSGYPACHFIRGNVVKPITIEDKVKDCPDCKGFLVLKKGRFGPFLACSNFPTCRHMEKVAKPKPDKEVKEKPGKDDGEMKF
jgi:DNA topoisomerase-1